MASGYFYTRLNQVKKLIEDYVYPNTLTLYLKAYFQQNKQLGSRDRKQVKHWFFLYFKSNNNLQDLEEELIALLLYDESEILEPLRSKFEGEKSEIDSQFTFPLIAQISLNLKEEQRANLKAEKLFWVRAQQVPQEQVLDSFNDRIYGMEKGVLDGAFGVKQVQDRASYEACCKIVAELGTKPVKLWDACAGAGGKSIAMMDLAADMHKDISLYTSDLRPQMVKTIIKRMKDAAQPDFTHTLADLSQPIKQLKFREEEVKDSFFDAIVIDAPCSGSGTWGRNAQHLRYFEQEHLDGYLQLQRNIVTNALPYLKKGGNLFYLTCSVYEAENEQQMEYFTENLGLKLVTGEYLGNKNSDVLYYCQLSY